MKPFSLIFNRFARTRLPPLPHHLLLPKKYSFFVIVVLVQSMNCFGILPDTREGFFETTVI